MFTFTSHPNLPLHKDNELQSQKHIKICNVN